MKPWQELLLNKSYPPERAAPYGRNGAQLCAALDVVKHTQWCHTAGTAIVSNMVTPVSSWHEVAEIIDRSRDSEYSGLIPRPIASCTVSAWAPDAEHRAEFMFGINAWGALHWGHVLPVPQGLDDDEVSRVHIYVNHSVKLLFTEIALSHRIDCTYFREQLAWFYAGHFPCGWDGDWPAGKMRVF